MVTYTRGLDLSGSLQGAGGIGGLLARTDANGSTFYHSDGAGNITALMDGQENIVARYLYNPFGKLIGQWGSMANANEMQFSSMPRDNLSGLSFYPFRAYEPNFQRWLNQDPIQEWGGINLYRFNLNNPLSLIDPLGFAGGEEDDNEVDPDEIRKNEQQFDDNWGIPRAPTTSPSGLAFEPIPQPSQPETEEQFDENLLKNPISSLAGKEREEEAADAEAAKAPKPTAGVPCPSGGRKGSADTRAFNQKGADQTEALGAKHTAGANLPEQYYRNPNGGRSGGRYTDYENTFPDGSKIVTQTVDTYANGDPTYDEVEAALDIYDRLEEGDRLVLVPKPK